MNAQSLEEFKLEIQVDNLTKISMEIGRRHGLDSKADEFTYLPKKQRLDRLEALIDFIQKANYERNQLGEDPNMYRDLSEEFDQQHPELPTPPGRRSRKVPPRQKREPTSTLITGKLWPNPYFSRRKRSTPGQTS